MHPVRILGLVCVVVSLARYGVVDVRIVVHQKYAVVSEPRVRVRARTRESRKQETASDRKPAHDAPAVAYPFPRLCFVSPHHALLKVSAPCGAL